MRVAAVLMISTLLAACAIPPPMPPAADLFHDEWFASPSVPIDPDAAMALSESMRTYLTHRIGARSRFTDRRQKLLSALYSKGELQLEYDAAVTRTAAQAFESRSGNCLALVMMTGAFAKALGLTVHYQIVLGDDAWDRAGELFLSVGHVNLTLADRPSNAGAGISTNDDMTVDFIPPRPGTTTRAQVIQEHTLIAMYLNNRAVESLTRGEIDDAYAWARAAIVKDPALLAAYLTLGVIYRNAQHPELADAALRRVIERQPTNTAALSNRVLVLHDLGRFTEADTLAQQLQRLDPHPPFSYFREGQTALREGRVEAARALFTKEVARAPYHHEFEFWLAITYMALHDIPQATEHLTRAMEVSTTRKDRDLYAAKLDRLKSLTAH